MGQNRQILITNKTQVHVIEIGVQEQALTWPDEYVEYISLREPTLSIV